MQNLSTKDKIFYLKSGALTTPFLEDNYIQEMVMRDYNHKLEKGEQVSQVESLLSWINFVIKLGDKNFRQKYKFKRTAQEIWQSGFATGCTDYAILFATFARQLGWSTAFLHTAEYGWLQAFLEGKDCRVHYGHSFCECYYEGKWILVDPASRKIVCNYNLDKIELPYKIGPGKVYIPYFRGLDLGKRTSIEEHNLEMEELCRALKK